MVRDELKNAHLYEGLGAGIASALRYLRETDLLALKPGKYEIRGKDLIAIVEEYPSKPLEKCFWEAHRKYIDVQHVVSGAERMGYANLAALIVRRPYDADKDLLVLDGQGDFFTVRTGMFTVFTPQDAHMPCLVAGEPAQVRKVVVKVAV